MICTGLMPNFSFLAQIEAEIVIWPPKGEAMTPLGAAMTPLGGKGGRVNLKKNLKQYVQVSCKNSASQLQQKQR